ncbi:MAG: sigma 54-interacting transcriptional regulator [Myxococcales bacterium]
MPFLVFRGRGRDLFRVPLERACTVFGRGPDADFPLLDRSVSWRHFAIHLDADRLGTLEDLSGRGTRLNGAALSRDRARLAHGDEVEAGVYRATYREELEEPEGEGTDPGRPPTAVAALEHGKLPDELFLFEQSGPGEPRRHPLGDRLSIGSGAGCGLSVDDPLVSERHAEIVRRGHELALLDTGSRNGVWLDEDRVVEAALRLGRRFRIGFTTFWVAAAEPVRDYVVFQGMAAKHPAMLELFAEAERGAKTEAAVLITGESGTGKEPLSRAVHALSRRAAGPFVTFDCAVVDPQVAASTLFGHEKGAFTGADRAKTGAVAEAEGGTLYLHEVGELPLAMQPKLLRLLDEGYYQRVGSSRDAKANVRIVAATNRDLPAEVAAKGFRLDLFYRLNGKHLHLPALRDRLEDVPCIWSHFFSIHCPGVAVRLSGAALEKLYAHRWPGNVRELLHLAGPFREAGESAEVGPESLRFAEGLTAPAPGIAREGKTLDQILEAVTAEVFEATLRETGGNQREAARRLDVSRARLERWRKGG